MSARATGKDRLYDAGLAFVEAEREYEESYRAYGGPGAYAHGFPAPVREALDRKEMAEIEMRRWARVCAARAEKKKASK